MHRITLLLSLLSRALPVLALIFLLVVAWNLSDFIPIWDGGWFLGCAMDASLNLGDISKFNCGVHEPAIFYMGLLALVHYVSGGSLSVLHFFNLALLFVAMWASFRLLRSLFPAEENQRELALVAAISGTFPILVAIVFNTSLDFSVAVFLVLYALAIAKRSVLGALLAASALAFSKETGLLMYALSLPFVALFATEGPLFSKQRFRSALRYAPLLLPGIFHFVYFLMRPDGYSLQGKVATQLCWTEAKEWYQLFLQLNFSSKTIQNYLFNIFALNFNWILTAIIAVALFKILAAFARAKFSRAFFAVPTQQTRAQLFVLALFIVSIYASTRCPFYNNPKYIAPSLMLLAIVSYGALLRVVASAPLRQAFLSGFLILNCFSLFRTLDPISRSYYGTIPFGQHRILHMTSRTNECCGYGQDQLVYNLEFTNLHYLVGEAFKELRIKASDPLVVPTRAWMLRFFDSESWDRGLNPKNPVSYWELSADEAIHNEDIGYVYYIDYAFHDTREDLEKLRGCFRQEWRKEFFRDGYSLPIYRFVRTGSCPAKTP
ncbi:MAG: hypothetical protein J0M12_00445 [Deltaproteobacteria bacterium]|nr:hypothetical protein [Deltaproteobacteria bacterium]